jgi:dienelactone hydrolase
MSQAFVALARRARRRADLVIVALALAAWALGAATGPLVRTEGRFVREDVRIPAADGRQMLAVTILRPRGNGPFGAIVLNHGVPVSAEARSHESPAMLIHTAAAFVQRNYAVIMPLRRGFGATGGTFAEDAGPCSNPDYRRGERAAAADVLAAYDFARKLPYVDGSRMVLAGQSAGGVASLYAAAHAPEGLMAVLAFAAGRGGNPAVHPGVSCAQEHVARGFEALGARVKAPVLLYYAENDHYFGPSTSRAWFNRFKAAGARAEYVLQPPFGREGHYLFSDAAGVRLWLPNVERFLQRHGIPFDAPQQRT